MSFDLSCSARTRTQWSSEWTQVDFINSVGCALTVKHWRHHILMHFPQNIAQSHVGDVTPSVLLLSSGSISYAIHTYLHAHHFVEFCCLCACHLALCLCAFFVDCSLFVVCAHCSAVGKMFRWRIFLNFCHEAYLVDLPGFEKSKKSELSNRYFQRLSMSYLG